MHSFRLPFSGSASFADRLEGYTGYLVGTHNAWYRCAAVEVIETGDQAEGYAVFEQLPQKHEAPIFPWDLLLELLASHP